METNSNKPGNISPAQIQFAEGNTVELVAAAGPNRLINNINLAAYSPNGNGNPTTVSVTNGWPAMPFFDNASQYSAVMGQAATAGAAQAIELNNLRVANANQLGQYQGKSINVC